MQTDIETSHYHGHRPLSLASSIASLSAPTYSQNHQNILTYYISHHETFTSASDQSNMSSLKAQAYQPTMSSSKTSAIRSTISSSDAFIGDRKIATKPYKPLPRKGRPGLLCVAEADPYKPLPQKGRPGIVSMETVEAALKQAATEGEGSDAMPPLVRLLLSRNDESDHHDENQNPFASADTSNRLIESPFGPVNSDFENRLKTRPVDEILTEIHQQAQAHRQSISSPSLAAVVPKNPFDTAMNNVQIPQKQELMHHQQPSHQVAGPAVSRKLVQVMVSPQYHRIPMVCFSNFGYGPQEKPKKKETVINVPINAPDDDISDITWGSPKRSRRRQSVASPRGVFC
jgi:hypothetical protein